jgi:hypothetical protein
MYSHVHVVLHPGRLGYCVTPQTSDFREVCGVFLMGLTDVNSAFVYKVPSGADPDGCFGGRDPPALDHQFFFNKLVN